MAAIHLNGSVLDCEPDETLLDCLERHGAPIRSSCRSGTCQTCLVQATEGSPPLNAQSGLTPQQMMEKYFLACCAYITSDLHIVLDGQKREYTAAVISVEPLNGRVVRLRCSVPKTFSYRAGQFMNIVGPGGDVRSYSLASLPEEDAWLEFHVALIPGGKLSPWIGEALNPGDRLTMIGPQGSCFYAPGNSEQPLLLAGTGTGLAPLYGIVRDALRHGHRGPIHLFHGSVAPEGLYYTDELKAIAHEHGNLRYSPCVLKGGGGGLAESPIDAFIAQTLPDLTGYRVFLCGDAALVRNLQQQVFLAGADMDAIHADPFLPAA